MANRIPYPHITMAVRRDVQLDPREGDVTIILHDPERDEVTAYTVSAALAAEVDLATTIQEDWEAERRLADAIISEYIEEAKHEV